MSNRKALLQAVLDAPEDDAPRLVYADWLEEHGDEADHDRAEFIRAQVALEKLDEDDPQREGLEGRARELLVTHRQAWEDEIPAWARNGLVFRRGFLDQVSVTASQWRRSAGTLLKAAPVQVVSLSGTAGRFADLFASRHLARVRRLELQGGKVGLDDLRALVSSPHLGALTALNLFGQDWYTAGANLLADWPGLANLQRLSVCGARLGSAGCQVLVASPALAGLTALGLPSNNIGREGFCALAASPHLAGLRHLNLYGNIPEREGVAALLAAPFAPGLETLHLGGNQVGPGWLPPLSHLANLRCLLLRNNRLGDDEVAALASELPPQLRSLALDVNPISDRGARTLADSPHLAGLRRLQLDGRSLSPDVRNLLRQRFGDRVTF